MILSSMITLSNLGICLCSWSNSYESRQVHTSTWAVYELVRHFGMSVSITSRINHSGAHGFDEMIVIKCRFERYNSLEIRRCHIKISLMCCEGSRQEVRVSEILTPARPLGPHRE